MLQYLLNMSAIWLLSLIVFDLFLAKESFHNYNRMYLLGTCLMGILLPLWSLQPYSIEYAVNISRPVAERAATIKGNMVTGQAATTVLSMWTLLRIVYITGVVIFSFLLLKDIFLLFRLYQKGTKSKDGVWTVIETNQEHTPFSAFRMVFISSKGNYTPEELIMILNHEEQHGHALHFADQLLLQIARILFWFHPLIYVYYNRMVMLHEYQADKAVNNPPSEYGRFLVEQAILQSAPALTHSFNRSPIKKRILMLTKRSTGFAQSKTLLSLPLILVCILCFTKNAFSDDKRVREGNKIKYRGNVIEMKIYPNDTVIVIDPVTGKQVMKVATRDPKPEKLNDKHVYEDYEIEELKAKKQNTLGSPATNKPAINSNGVKEYLLSNLKDEIKHLPDGRYFLRLDNIILNENGEIVFFEYNGLSANGWDEKEDPKKAIDKALQDDIAKKIAKLLIEAPKHTPAVVNGEDVPYLIDNTIFWNPFIVKNGKVTEI